MQYVSFKHAEQGDKQLMHMALSM